MLINEFIAAAEASLAQRESLAELCGTNTVTVEGLNVAAWHSAGVAVDVIRADLVDPVISGNKWFKLKYHLLAASAHPDPHLLSFGGAWSNHLHALAHAAQRLGWQSTGVIRGDELDVTSNPALQDMSAAGMQLQFVSRQHYRALRELAPSQAVVRWPQCYVIPEGGSGWLGAAGSASLATQLDIDWSIYDAILLAVGTGCTLAGIASSSPIPVWGVPACRGADAVAAIAASVERLLQAEPNPAQWELLRQYAVTGFGPASCRAQASRRQVEEETGVEFDAIYGARVLDAIFDMIARKTLRPGYRILLLHSGGIQGNRGGTTRL